MGQYISKYATIADYEAAVASGLDTPHTALVKEDMRVRFHEYEPPKNIITYNANAKLTEITSGTASGLHTNAFSGKNGQLTMTNHEFNDGIGTVTFSGDITSIGQYAFFKCTGLTNVTIPDSVTSIGEQAFSVCSGLTSIEIPNSVTSIGNTAFSSCRSLTSITIPNGVTSIGTSVFSYCSGLTSITIPNGVTSIANTAFDGCTGLTSIVVDSGNTVYDSRDNCNAIITTSTNALILGCKNTVIPNSVTIIGNYAFQYCSGLTSITIPNSVTSIGQRTFYGCSNLTSITCNAATAPTIGSNTFQNIKTGGTLTVPAGATGYDVWMGTGDYYLGKYSWTKVER